ncbi:hypothetical protein [Streptomyces sp. NPDC005141]
MLNPTVVVITDRNDLDDQLYSTFLESEILPGTRPGRRTTFRRGFPERLGSRRG